MAQGGDSTRVSDIQQRHQREEFQTAVRALLMKPLMPSQHPDFPTIRRQTARLQEWFQREAGWPLHVSRDGARLFKRPADLSDATRGLPGYTRQRYALLCLACAVLERSDSQITLQFLGKRLLEMADDPVLTAKGLSFTLTTQGDRRDLVTVCRTLQYLGVLGRVAGAEEGFIQNAAGADALYDVRRPLLSGLLAAVRGPSTWPTEAAPLGLEDRLQALVAEHVPDSEEGKRSALRHQLARRFLDDPVTYADRLRDDARAYYTNQRGVLASRLCDATGLVAEQRAEGVALTDADGALTDIAMPAEGTEAHATLLVADHLAHLMRDDPTVLVGPERIAAFLADARDHFGHYWRKSAQVAGGEKELATIAIERLESLRLISREASLIRPLPALHRFALGSPQIRRKAPPQTSLLEQS